MIATLLCDVNTEMGYFNIYTDVSFEAFEGGDI
jgi:hypothetical protein